MEEKLDLIIQKLDVLINLESQKNKKVYTSGNKQQTFDFFDDAVKNQEKINKNKAAIFLGISRRCIYNYLKEWRELRKTEHAQGLKPKF